jgi:hypothetical protein
VSLDFKLIVAPAMTAPDESVTVPLIAPVTVLCAATIPGTNIIRAASKATSPKGCLYLISRSPVSTRFEVAGFALAEGHVTF